MKAAAVAGFLIGLVFCMITLVYEPSQKAERQAEARALGFVIYRNAVNEYAQEHRTPGVVASDALSLPAGLANVASWSNQVVPDGNELRCFVYGPADAEEIQAVRRLLRGSLAIGWNDRGTLMRDGEGVPLPGFIPSGALVSVISIH